MKFAVIKKKALKSTESTNFWISTIGLFAAVVGVLTGVGVDVSQLEALVAAISAKNITGILVAATGAALGLYNYFKANKVNKPFMEVIRDRNIWTAVISVLAGLFAWLGIGSFPEQQAEALVDAIYSGDLALTITAGWTLISNIIFIIKNRV